MMNLILLGLPGAGKGTQAKLINQEYNLPHIATGDIFRKAVKEQTLLGKEIKKKLDVGKLIEDKQTINIIKERLKEDDCNFGFILDGFPRTLNQAQALTEILAGYGKKINLAFYLKVDEIELIRRLSGRRICENCGASYHLYFNLSKVKGICDRCGGKLVQRSDDQKETVKNRIHVNTAQMDRLISYYDHLGILKIIECNKGIDEVFTQIKKIIEVDL